MTPGTTGSHTETRPPFPPTHVNGTPSWTEGATDTDVEAIKRAMESRPRPAQIVVNATVVDPLAPTRIWHWFGTGTGWKAGKSRIQKGNLWWKGRDSKHYEAGGRSLMVLPLDINVAYNVGCYPH